jgi:hypothetical protein
MAKGGKRKGVATGTVGKKVTIQKASGGAVSVTPAKETPVKETASASTGKEVSFRTASPQRRAATGIALEHSSSPVKEMHANDETHAPTTSKSFSSSSSSSNSSSDDEESDDTNKNRRKEENHRNYEQKENGTRTATHEEMYLIAQGSMGAIKND